MTDTPSKTNTTSTRRPDCVTEIRMGNTVLTVSGYFKQDTTDTAADIFSISRVSPAQRLSPRR